MTECDGAGQLPSSRINSQEVDEDDSAKIVQCCNGGGGRVGVWPPTTARRSGAAILIFILLVSCVVDIEAGDSEHKNQNCKYRAIC